MNAFESICLIAATLIFFRWVYLEGRYEAIKEEQQAAAKAKLDAQLRRDPWGDFEATFKAYTATKEPKKD